MNALTEPLATFWLGMVNHLWQCTLVLAVLVVLERLLRRAPAALRADLWTLGLGKLVLPALLGGTVAAAVSMRLAGDVPTAGAVVATVLAPAPASVAAVPGWWGPLLLALTAAWLGGVAVAGVKLADDLRSLPALRRDARPVTGPTVSEAARRAGVPREHILVAPGVSLPLVVGWWRPVILVPVHLSRVLAPIELEALLRHEDRHRRRRDPLRMLVGRVAAAVFWFYPPLRWLLGRLNECSEYACDEAALDSGAGADLYLRALSRAISRGLDPASPVAAAAGGGPGLMRRRLARLRGKERPTMKYGRLVLVAAILVVGAAVFVPLDLVAAGRPPAPPAEEAPPAPPAPPEKGTAPAPPAAEADDPPPPPAKKKESAAGEDLVVKPRMIKMVEPVYPERGKKDAVEGVVVLAIVVSAKGKVIDIQVVKGVEDYPGFAKAATVAVSKSEFEPGTINGEPAKLKTKVKIHFELD